MCGAGAALGKSLGEVEELAASELLIWDAWLAEREKEADMKRDLRSLGVCMAIIATAAGKVPELEAFFPAVFEEHSAQREITDPEMMRDVMVGAFVGVDPREFAKRKKGK